MARGFYDRLPAARAAAVTAGRLDQAGLRAVAEAHAVCPYYLGQEMARWADVAVGDYNYFFDVTALLHGLRQAGGWRVGVLVDEAHNLVERGRAMYTAELDQAAFAALRKTAPAALKRHFDKLQRGWNAFNAAQVEPYRAYAEPPQALLAALQQLALAIGDHLNQRPDQLDPPLQRAQFDALHFLRMADCFGPHSLFDASLRPASGARRKPASTLCLRNLVPAPFLAPRFAAAQSCVLFSATLSPADYYREMLGLAEDTPRLEVESPFRAEQLAVRVAPRISTRYGDRAGSLRPIADVMARQYRAEPGNYLAFFSSFAYLEQALAELARQAPDIPCWTQTRGMDEPARRDFLARFTPDGCGIGFAVLGGAFAEGIDLRGPRLIGAFIATLGLPQLNPVNEQLRQRLHELFGRGYEYAYLYPGLQKVVQAAGRVIRGTEDRGVVYLLDDRYAEAKVAALLPAWWRVEFDVDGEAGSP
ncbi:ATP-dependent DNA helicase [Chitinimonas koreensis]|uniref:ATP-dependent DNA helicase n=1 Tax=Chitinimonas koreensis TaxID=356302 RepID=UPI0027E40559|nr:ATP-dependent DNA helicase [Chitinimonas koreensis]